MADVDVHVSSHLKEELAWAADKLLWVINSIMKILLRSKKELKNKAV